jgi:hypothetical protein
VLINFYRRLPILSANAALSLDTPSTSTSHHRRTMSEENRASPGAANKPEDAAPAAEHLNIKVTDNNNEVFFKIKRSTQLKKLMDAFCERQGKAPASVRFLFDGSRVQPTDSPDTVSFAFALSFRLILVRVCPLLLRDCCLGDSTPRCQTRTCLLTLSTTARHAGWGYLGGPSGADRRMRLNTTTKNRHHIHIYFSSAVGCHDDMQTKGRRAPGTGRSLLANMA